MNIPTLILKMLKKMENKNREDGNNNSHLLSTNRNNRVVIFGLKVHVPSLDIQCFEELTRHVCQL